MEGKTKVGWSDDAASDDGNSNNDGGPNGGGGAILITDCDGDGAETDDGYNVMSLMEIKMMVMAMMLMVVVMMKVKEVVIMMKDVVMLMLMLKMVIEMMLMIKMIVIFKMAIVLKANICNSILLAFPQFLMWIYYLLVQLDVNNLCSKTICQVISLYEPSCDLARRSICWFHLCRIFLGNYLPSKFYFFA